MSGANISAVIGKIRDCEIERKPAGIGVVLPIRNSEVA
jgi:hypothetical protein